MNLSTMSIFGEKISSITYAVRPGAYAVIFDNGSSVAAVRGETGYFLPGGGLADGETPEAALHREILEECATTIEISDMIGRATDFIYSANEDTHFEKQGIFYLAHFTAPPASKDLEWLALDSATKVFRQQGHAWAVMHAQQKAGMKR